jgi:hypothetical protein
MAGSSPNASLSQLGTAADLPHRGSGYRGPRVKFALPIGLVFVHYEYMAKSVSVLRKKRGRPATGQAR